MTPPASSTLSLNDALTVLSRLQKAAPAPTAARIAQVMALLETLEQENNYFSSLLNEAETAPPPAGFAVQPTAQTDALVVEVSAALRGPLNALRSRADQLQNQPGLSAEQAQQVRGLQQYADSAFQVLDATEKLLALQQGQVQVQLDAFIPTDLLREAYARSEALAHEYQHEMHLKMPETIPLCQGDFYQCLIILLGLVENAIRYTPPGGIIRLSVDNVGTHVLFNVADTGIGLHAEDVPEVGKAFWRNAQNPLVKAHHGTGLTLCLARQILALQGGELIFFGQAGQGSTFSFTLPIVA
jgi:two-component system sensor histidine kinase BaeS